MSSPTADDNEMAKLWKGRSGRAWVDLQDVLDGMLAPLADLLVADIPAGSAESVLDIGCGAGASTRAAARRLGPEGRCVGVDISEALLEAARAQSMSSDGTLAFINADAETHAFQPATFDRVISRFGVMFFGDPLRAFTNLHDAAKPDAKLHLVTWRGPADNPFMTTAERAAAPYMPALPPRAPNAPGQFGLADADYTHGILEHSGWREIDIQAHDAPCAFPARDLERYFTRTGLIGPLLEDVSDSIRAQIIADVRTAFASYVHGDEVRFTAATWQMRARA